ncbi:hypothetical protein [Hyphomicrobium sp.]|uniref:hypothetical protein n=1 Tax=Hyphomicrobium sp. TaxID=82 RepID=UPI0025C1B287|nr:hypothetical protein [Hyphomicrobium sp.]MCC7252817.1 hypothetical protein [Hyphomicrobium sp.]
MKALVTVLSGLAGAVIGWVVAAAATLMFGEAFGLTEFEGERSMTAVFGIGPIGGLVGLVVGLWLALRMYRPRM